MDDDDGDDDGDGDGDTTNPVVDLKTFLVMNMVNKEQFIKKVLSMYEEKRTEEFNIDK